MNGWSAPNRASGMKKKFKKLSFFPLRQSCTLSCTHLLLHDFFIFRTLHGGGSSVPEKNPTAEVVLGIVSGHNICQQGQPPVLNKKWYERNFFFVIDQSELRVHPSTTTEYHTEACLSVESTSTFSSPKTLGMWMIMNLGNE